MDKEGGVRNWLSTHLGFRSNKENIGQAISREHLDNGMGVRNISSTIYEVYLTNKSGEMTVYVHSKWMEDEVTINKEEGLGNSLIIYKADQTNKS